MAILPLTPRPSSPDEPPPAAAALARLERAVERFRETTGMTSHRNIREQLASSIDALDAVLEWFQADAERRGSLADAAPIHHAATLCAHATEMLMVVNDHLWRRDLPSAREYLARVQQATMTIIALTREEGTGP